MPLTLNWFKADFVINSISIGELYRVAFDFFILTVLLSNFNTP